MYKCKCCVSVALVYLVGEKRRPAGSHAADSCDHMTFRRYLTVSNRNKKTARQRQNRDKFKTMIYKERLNS